MRQILSPLRRVCGKGDRRRENQKKKSKKSKTSKQKGKQKNIVNKVALNSTVKKGVNIYIPGRLAGQLLEPRKRRKDAWYFQG
jgi:hypothetical protein